MLDFSISMTVGEVTFGNIGAPNRLTFPATGPAASKVARLDEVIGAGCWRRGRWRWPGRISVGMQPLRDFDEPLALFARACTREAFLPAPATAAAAAAAD